MEINNLKIIEPLLTFRSEDDYYHLQILKRKKDCAEHERAGNNNARCLKTYYIHSLDYLNDRMDEIKKLCINFDARAYINLNVKSYQKTAYMTNEKIAQRMRNNQFEYIYKSYESAAGTSEVNSGTEKRWILDIDTKDSSFIKAIENRITMCRSKYMVITGEEMWYDNLITIIPTVNGVHLITKEFQLNEMDLFRTTHPFDVQKNNPTLLYFNPRETLEMSIKK
jgi:hypothetical protein